MCLWDISNASLQRESDDASRERLQLARKAIAEVDDQLKPLKAQYENEKRLGDEIAQVRRRIDELKAKADDAERRFISTASYFSNV
jgi:ATP-dependent Clp protease ATP-binding subunit ClpB